MSEAKFTYKFAYDLDQLAKEKHVKMCNLSIDGNNHNSKGHYDYLKVEFLIPRPDLDSGSNRGADQKITENTVSEIVVNDQKEEV